jgi:hypothetical protein
MPIAPTLILGLGGTGSKIIERVHDKLARGSQSERIAFVVFDTDINDLAEIKRRSPDIYPVQTSTRSTVGEYLNINTNARDTWFPVNEMLNRKTLTEGAAQVRAISRLAFDTTLKAGNLEPLHRAVEQLFRIDKDQEEQALRIIITSSLAGGTGSGLILPVAMYLNNFLRTKYPKAKAITRGFFVQPDVFYSVISATEEQQNLQVNAYAAIRELDAFLMKGDNTLPEQYRDLAFEFPKMAADGVDVVNAMPYDFCFLFDANNTSGGGLDSFDSYLDHAATCIYTLSIGPMSKKSNSREDNVLREVIKNDGRNRYAGAGASRLVYPWEHVRDYVANMWADQAMSTQWLKFDQEIQGMVDALAKQREKGFAAQDLPRPKIFTGLVDTQAENKDPFASLIRNQCLAYDEDGFSVVGQRWTEYVGEMKKHVERQAMNDGDDVLKRNVQSQVGALGETTDADDYVAAYQELKKYHDRVERHTKEKAGVIAYSLFQADNATVTKDRHAHQLETYLREKVSGGFIHPVSARFFLYQTLQALQSEKQRVSTELSKTLDYFATFEAKAFDNPETEDEESPEEFANRKKTLGERLRRKPGPELQELSDKFNSYIKRGGQLRNEMAYDKVLEDGIEYVKGLSEAFETFFTSLESNLRRLRTDTEQLRVKYDDLTGSTTRYVLAASTSLDYTYHSMRYAGNVVSVDSELSESIYTKVRQYYMLTDEKSGSYFQDLYKDTIIGYFRDQVMKRHEGQIKIDVIEALEREYRATTNNFEEGKISHYVVAEIEKVKKLAAPFLEQPLGEERHPIQACAYNPKLIGESDPKRKSLIEENLGNYGGQADPEISVQEILFYNAIYGIRARDLSKYAPARDHATEKRPAGSYFASYHQLVSGIRPSVTETRVITPHLDRRWHTIAAMPDLDDGYQDVQLAAVHKALLTGLAHKVVVWETVHDDTRIYRYRPTGSLEREFVVSNGTPCDQFYEVVDALMINPVAVGEITSTVDRRVAYFLEEEHAAAFDKSPFAEALAKGLSLGELGNIVAGMKDRKVTIFDVATFYAVSVPKQQHSDAALRQMVVNFLNYIKGEIDAIADASDAVPVFEKAMRAQFDTFRENVPAYLATMGPTFARRVRTVVRPLSESLAELHIRGFATEVEDFEESLRSI